MSGIIKNSKGEILCYDEKNPMIFHDLASADSWLTKEGYYKKLGFDELLEDDEFVFEEINVVQNN